MDEVRNPMCTRVPRRMPTVLQGQPGHAAPARRRSRRGSATARRTSGSRRPARRPPGRRASASRTCPTWSARDPAGVPDCSAADDGCQTFYYTNQQSARLMFYHDHSWGITRLNVYAGEAAGYLITDDTEKKLIGQRRSPGLPTRSRSIVQDRPSSRVRRPAGAGRIRPGTRAAWGGQGQPLVPPRVHAGAEPRRPVRHERLRPLDVRAVVLAAGHAGQYGPIANPYYDPGCNLDDPATWQYQTDPFCEPEQIPGTPNISVGMEQFNDTPIVNGDGLPDHDARPEDLPPADAERGQRPLLQPSSGTSPTRPRDDTRSRSRPRELAAAQTDPTSSRRPIPRSARPVPTGSRSAPRAASCRPRRSLTASSRPPGSPTRPASTSATSTSTRCFWLRPSAPT